MAEIHDPETNEVSCMIERFPTVTSRHEAGEGGEKDSEGTEQGGEGSEGGGNG